MAPPNSATPGAAQKALQESCSRALALQGMKYNPQPGLACLPRLVGAQLRGFYIALGPLPSSLALRVTPWLLHGKGEGRHDCHTSGGRQTRKSNLRPSWTFCHLSYQLY